MKRFATLLLLPLCACFHVRLNESTGDAEVKKVLFANPLVDATPENPCPTPGGPLRSVHVSSHLGFAWLSVLTFGFVNLVNVEYSCAPQTGIEPTPTPCPDP